MIRLPEKLLIQKDEIHREYETSLRYTLDYQKCLSINRKVLVQEMEMIEGRKVSDYIVSIDRHYVRPFISGKETSSVKLDAKVNNIQIDGISFIERISFKAFKEGIRLKDCISMQQKLINVKVRCVTADSIYANNFNRKFCIKIGISTSFVHKERAAKNESLKKVLRSELSRIKARNGKTEILWIFFGKHTANARRTDDRQDQKQSDQGGIACICRNNQKKSSDFFWSIISCLVKLCREIQKKHNNNGI